MGSQELAQSEANLRAIFDNASEGFILTDRAGIVKTFNGNAAKYVLFNTGKVLAVDQHLYNFIDPQKAGFVNDMIAKVLGGASIEFERMFLKEGAEPLWLHFCKTPVWEKGRVVGICITTRDITERKKLEHEILHQKVQEHKKIARAIINAQEIERNYIASELHDNVNQILAGTKIYLVHAGKDNADLEALIAYSNGIKPVIRCVAHYIG